MKMYTVNEWNQKNQSLIIIPGLIGEFEEAFLNC